MKAYPWSAIPYPMSMQEYFYLTISEELYQREDMYAENLLVSYDMQSLIVYSTIIW